MAKKSKPTAEEKAEEREQKRLEDVKAVRLYEDLLISADGGEPFLCGEFHASTILAMFKNPGYARRIEKLHDKLKNG